MADANIFQGAIFHEEDVESTHAIQSTETTKSHSQQFNGDNSSKSLEEVLMQKNPTPKPAVHQVLEFFLLIIIIFFGNSCIFCYSSYN